jgi:type I restriction enzyme S subunit
MKFTPSNSIADGLFLYYLFSSLLMRAQIRDFGIGSSVPGFNLGQLRSMTLTIPPLEEQLSIAHVLGVLDDKIELLRSANQTLEAIGRAIFNSWFVDFDPVRAKAQGREPEGIDADTAALFPDEFQDSEFGPLPAGWHLPRARDLMKQSRDSINPLQHSERLFAHYSLPAFDEGRRPKLEYGREIKSSKTAIPEGCILLSKLNPHIPRVWLPSSNIPENAVCSREFLVFQPLRGFSVEYLYCQFVEPGFAQRFGGLTTGTSKSHQRVKVEYLLDEKLIKPEPGIVDAFTSLTRPMFEKIHANLEAQQTLAELRDTLLPRLISGKLRVPDAEKLLEAVL